MIYRRRRCNGGRLYGGCNFQTIKTDANANATDSRYANDVRIGTHHTLACFRFNSDKQRRIVH